MYNKVKNLVQINKDFLANTLKSYVVTIVNLVVLVFSTRYIVKSIGVDQYGLWILIQNVLGYMGIMQLGYITSFSFYFGRKVLYEESDEKKRKYLSTHFFLFIGMGIVISLFALLVVAFPQVVLPNEQHKDVFQKALLLFLPGYLGLFLTQAFEGILFNNFKMFNNRLFNEFINNSGQSIIFCIAIYFGMKSLYWLATIYTIIAIFVSVKNFTFFLQRVSFRPVFALFDFKMIKGSFRYSFSFWFINVCNVVLNQIDFLFISKILNSNPFIVLYAQTGRIPQFFYTLITKVTNNKSPKITDLYSRNNMNQIKPIVNNLLLVTFGAAVLGSLFFIFLGKYVLALWLGDLISFDQKLITIFGLILVPRSLQWVFWTYFNNVNEPKYNLYAGLVEIILNITVSMLLIKNYELLGLAIGSLVAQVSSNLILFYFYKRHYAK